MEQECEQLTVVDLKTEWLLRACYSQPLVKRIPWHKASPDLNGSRNAGFIDAVSDLALIMPAEPDMPFDQDGINPQRINENTRRGSFGC